MTKTEAHTKTASALLVEYLESIGAGDPRATASYFAEDGCIDAPYVESFGMQAKIVGPAAIENTMTNLLKTAPNFRLKNIKIILETPTVAVAEYESEALMTNGKTYKQLYMAQLYAKDGKIVCHREFLNTIPFVEAFFPNGLKDLLTNKEPQQ
jgi:ketosteroid isomerase-like protein